MVEHERRGEHGREWVGDAFPGDVREVLIVREGDRRVIVPADRAWDDFFDSPGIAFPDRDQPAMQEREAL